MTTLPIATVKAHLSQYVEDAWTTHERFTITRNGVPTGVLMSVDDLESLEETLDILSDPLAMADIHQAQQEIDNGLAAEWTDFSPRRD